MRQLKVTNTSIRLRRIGEDDMDVLCQVYASTRTEEMQRVPQWSAEMKEAFLKSQSQNSTSTISNHVGGDFWVIEKAGTSIGRLYVHQNFQNRGVRIIDIALLPTWRNQGIGRGILRDIMRETTALNRPLTIHVESSIPLCGFIKDWVFKK